MFAARLWRVTGTPGMRCAAQSLRPPLFSRRHFHPIRLASTSPNQAPVSSQPRQSIERARPTRPPKQATHKPPRRRMEAASLPLRNETAPTRGPILQCIAHTTAERYDLSALAVTLRRLGVRWDEPWKGRGGAERLIRGKDVRPEAEDEGDDLGFEYGERGEILVFHSGSFVTWGLTEEEGRAFLRNVIRTKGSRVEHGRLADADCEVEEADFVVDPEAQTHILGNLILLGRPPELSTFSSSSPALASLLARYTLIFGEQPLGRRDVIRKAGELMTLRMAVNTRGGGLEDTPEFYWSEPELEQYFDAIANEFEMKERVETINKKIDYAQEVQSTLRALLTEASGHRMEIIIILLIAVEVVFLLIREGPELYEELVHPVMGRVKDVLGPLTKPSSAPRVRGVAPAPEPVTSAPEAEANDEPRRLV
ncbi:hypothetical protein CcaverHIS002_0105290 [Cutaneotrichosporon cavernicola]|nr:hypothetical protein CcaverHIS002_0105290 [Cutaneotrichosporon cavernicola]